MNGICPLTPDQMSCDGISVQLTICEVCECIYEFGNVASDCVVFFTKTISFLLAGTGCGWHHLTSEREQKGDLECECE